MRNTIARLVCQFVASMTILVVAVGNVTAQTFDRAAWQKDYSLLKQDLERRYSNLAWFASPESGVDLPALDRRTLAMLNVATSDDDAQTALLNFVRSFHDGHFSQLTAQSPAGSVKSVTPANPDYKRSDAFTGCAAMRYAPYDLPSFTLPFESLPGFHLVADGIATPFRAGIFRSADSAVSLAIVRIPSFDETADQGLCLKAWTRDDVWEAQGKLVRRKLRDAVERSWYEELAVLLRVFKTAGVAAVVVDIGSNSGGDDSGDIAARLFTTKPLRSSPLWLSQDSAASTGYFNEQIEALRAAQQIDSANEVVKKELALFLQRQSELTKNICAMDWVWTARRMWTGNSCRRLVDAGSAGGPLPYLARDSIRNAEVGRRLHWPTLVASLWGTWSGPVYVLTDSRTYSAAEMFAAVLQNNRAAKIIGMRTGGDGCGFMNTPPPVSLPHSGLRFRVPNCVRIKSDGMDEVTGVIPDIPVLPTEGETSRARAMRVLDLVRADFPHPFL